MGEDAGDRGSAVPGILIRETPDGLGVYRPSERNGRMVSFLLVWLLVWIVGEAIAFGGIMSGESRVTDVFLLLWLAIWTLGGLLALLALLGQFFGTERLFITQGSLVLSPGLGPLRWRRIAPLDRVRNVRVETVSREKSKVMGKERHFERRAVLFDTDAGTRIFGTGLDEHALAAVRGLILRHLPAEEAGMQDRG